MAGTPAILTPPALPPFSPPCWDFLNRSGTPWLTVDSHPLPGLGHLFPHCLLLVPVASFQLNLICLDPATTGTPNVIPRRWRIKFPRELCVRPCSPASEDVMTIISGTEGRDWKSLANPQLSGTERFLNVLKLYMDMEAVRAEEGTG
jgi:hypothetical protein